MSKFSGKLKNMKQNWKDSQNQYDTTFGSVKIDAGNYIVRLQKAKVAESKSTSFLMIVREHIITEGKFQGSVIVDYVMLENKDNNNNGLVSARRWIEMMGYEAPDDLGKLESFVDTISEEGALLEVNIKPSGDNFFNVTVLKLLDDEGDGDGDGDGDGSGDGSGDGDSSGDDKEGEGDGNGDGSGDEEEDEVTAKIRAFCEAQGVEVKDDDDLEVLKERLSEYDWPEKEMTEDEVKSFKDAGIESLILKEKKKPLPKKKKKK